MAGSEKDLGCPNLLGQEQREGWIGEEDRVAGRREKGGAQERGEGRELRERTKSS